MMGAPPACGGRRARLAASPKGLAASRKERKYYTASYAGIQPSQPLLGYPMIG